MSDTTTHPKPGTVIAGKYRVERVIGKGGMGVVVAAEHTLLKQRVALKFVLDTADHDATDRFMREARATARLESAHVCRVMDVGTTDSGAPYIVMELLSGMDLSARLLAFGALPIADAVDYTLQLLDALSEAHARGIVHRDLKPSNLFLANRGDGSSILKVLDFGISKLQASPHDADTESTNRGAGTPKPVDPAQGLTETGVMMGSPPYMSPEQLRSARDVDARCDVWSVGTILHELLTATRAFPPGDDLFARILTGHHPSVRALRPEVPEDLARIVDRCLSVDPDARFPSAAEVAVALAPFGPPHTKMHVERAARWLANSGSGSSPALASLLPLPPSSGSAVPQTVHGVSLAPSASGASTARWWPRVTALAIAVAVVSMGAVVVQQRSARTRAAAIAPPPPSSPADSHARSAVASAVPASALASASASASALASALAPALAPAPASDDAGARRPPRARTGTPRAKPAASGEGVDLGRL